jgi:8-oxo-dGTP pyrophosphatase MutT (NUDIX family)
MFEIPEERLPPGFVNTVEETPADPAEPRPAATVVLVRDGDGGLEVLLMRRHRRSGFVPGAWVFPGGRVDPEDHDPALLDRCRGLSAAPVPEAAYWMAAIREAFEETGVLLARLNGGGWIPDAASAPEVEKVRRSLMDDEADLGDVVARLDAVLDVRPMVHAAHWVTPVVEARRYDTHFFLAALPEGREPRPDPREMTEAAWLQARVALERFEAGALPMVFPTVKTLETLLDHGSAGAALDAFRDRAVRRILPRLVRTAGGVGIVIDE